MATNISNLNIFVPFWTDMCEHSELILDSSYKFNISIQYSLITLPEFKIVYGKVSLEDILHVDSGLRRVTSTEGVQRIHHSHVQVNSFGLEQSTCRLALIQYLVDDLVAEIESLHRKLLSVNLLIRVSNVEGTTEKHVIIGRILTKT
jgi:hypothetical protein